MRHDAGARFTQPYLRALSLGMMLLVGILAKPDPPPGVVVLSDAQLLEKTRGCLDLDRLESAYTFLATSADSDNRPKTPVLEMSNVLKKAVLNETDFQVRYNGSGIFQGVEDAVEYQILGSSDMNGGDIHVDYMWVVDGECRSEDETLLQVYMYAYQRGAGWVYEKDPFLFAFAPDKSELLVRIDTKVPEAVYGVMSDATYDRRSLCEAAILRCPGELYPYKDVQDCYNTTAYIPEICKGDEDGSELMGFSGGILQGDTMACRYLHLLSAGLRPTIHCAHLANVSEKCVPQDCPMVTRLEEPVQIGPPMFDPGHAAWFRAMEMLVVFLLLVLCLVAKFWHSRERAFTSSDSITGNEKAPLAMPSRPFPSLEFDNLELKWSKFGPDDQELVLHVERGYLGGCSMTGLTGASGSGKTSFIKLLCGFSLKHMILTCDHWTNRDSVGFCPQSAEMWPDEMIVRDILFFGCAMVRMDSAQFQDCFKALGLVDLFDQPFKSLSGGQKQRVNIAAAIIHPKPTVIFLDEPLASLDAKNALACIRTLKKLPLDHAFVLTVHHVAPEVAGEFDRIVHFDGINQHKLEELQGPPSNRQFHSDEPISQNENLGSSSTIGTLQASIILWFGQFYGLPLVEMVVFICTVIGAMVVGALARKSTEDWVSSFLPTREATRIPFYIADVLVGMAFITSFGASLIYANRERKLMQHYVTLRLLKPSVYLGTLLIFRNIVHGIMQASCWILISLPLMGLLPQETDIVLVTTAVFGFAWGGATFGGALLVPSIYSAHVAMVMNVLIVFFSGVFFFMTRLYGVFRALHYLNPLFYTLSACAYLVLNHLDTNCDSAPNEHPGECASGSRILEMTEVEPFTSLAAQAYSIMFVSVFCFASYFAIRQNPRVLPTTGPEALNNNNNGNIAAKSEGFLVEEEPELAVNNDAEEGGNSGADGGVTEARNRVIPRRWTVPNAIPPVDLVQQEKKSRDVRSSYREGRRSSSAHFTLPSWADLAEDEASDSPLIED